MYILCLVNIENPLPNGHHNNASDTSSNHRTGKNGAPAGWIYALAGGGGAAAGVGGQSTISRKSGKKREFESARWKILI
jgi:hypothetical protein